MTQTTEPFLISAQSEQWLRVELMTSGRSCRLVLAGALCGNSITALDAQVDQLGAEPCEEVLVDLWQLRSIDERGAGVLVGLQHYVEARGGSYRIVGARGQVDRVIREFSRDFGSQT